MTYAVVSTVDGESVRFRPDAPPLDVGRDPFSGCPASAYLEDGSVFLAEALFCWLPIDHDGEHYDAADQVRWSSDV